MFIGKDIIICVYTCERDKEHLVNFYKRKWVQKYMSNPRIKFINVYADDSISTPWVMREDDLIVKSEERYDKLSLKSYKMIAAITQFTKFKSLIKVDCDLEYANSKYTTLIDSIIECKSTPDYKGARMLGIDREFRRWLWNNDRIKYNKDKMKRFNRRFLWTSLRPKAFWTGPIYSLNYDFCRYIVNYGSKIADILAKFGGMEDVMIASYYKRYKRYKKDNK